MYPAWWSCKYVNETAFIIDNPLEEDGVVALPVYIIPPSDGWPLDFDVATINCPNYSVEARGALEDILFSQALGQDTNWCPIPDKTVST